MPEQRIKELEQQLLTANENVAKLTASNAELTRELADAEVRNKKLRRSSKNHESSLRDQLATAQTKRS